MGQENNKNKLTAENVEQGGLIWLVLLLVPLGLEMLREGNTVVGLVLLAIGTALVVFREYRKSYS